MEFKTRMDWLKWRQGGIGSSDAAVIMGKSPWSTPRALYEQKIAEVVDEKTSFQMELGNEAEPKIRALYELLNDCEYPVKCFEKDYLRASLDGWCDGVFIEIKLSGKPDYEIAKSGRLPEKYKIQMEHQFLVTGAKKAHFLCYPYSPFLKERVVKSDLLIAIDIYPDLEYQKTLLEAEVNFWTNHVLKRCPPADIIMGQGDSK